MKNDLDIVQPGRLFVLEARPEIESHISALFPHWEGGSVIVTGVKESKLFGGHGEKPGPTGTVTLVEFLFQDRVYSENITDFVKRAKHIN